MDYARRLDRIPPYLFAEIDKAIAEKKSAGVDVISLGIGDPDLPTPERIVRRLQRAAEDPVHHRYPSYEGMLSFREAVAGWYRGRFGVSLNPEDEVLTLIGSKEGIGHVPLAFVNSGDPVLYTSPGYPVYKIGTILADGEPVALPLLEENGFLPDLDSVPAKTAGEAGLLFFNYPNNPTAAVASKKFFEEVVGFCREHDVIACHDAPYTEVSFDGYRAPSFLEADGARDVGVEFHSLSKTYNMAGWRIGMAVGNSTVIAGLGRVKMNVDSGAFQAVQEAGVEALTGSQECVAENNRILQVRRDLMVDGLKQLGWDVRRPKATFYLWVPVPGGGSSIEFAKKVLDRCGVVVTPGVGFGGAGEGYVRLSLTQETGRLEEALDRLRKLKE